MTKPEKPRYRLTLEAQAAPAPATVRLRRALKCLLRGFGFRVLKVEEVVGDPESNPAGPGDRLAGFNEVSPP